VVADVLSHGFGLRLILHAAEQEGHSIMLVTEQEAIRLFIVDRHPLITAALSQLLDATPNTRVVGSAQMANAGALRAAAPDVIMLTHEHGVTDMCAMIADCKAALPSVKTFVVSCHEHPELLQSVLEAGADGYTVKDVMPAELLKAIDTIASGIMFVDPRVGGTLLRQRGSSGRNGTGAAKQLSTREVDVVRLIADGMSNKEISSTLDLSEKTIKNHVSRIFEKLHVSSRTQVVSHAIKTGIA
jgi:DNA-binding NarL/FixJ family response regulator